MFAADGFKSAHGDTEPDFTTSKWREATGMQTRTIDYVFYKPGLAPGIDRIAGVSGTYQLPQRD